MFRQIQRHLLTSILTDHSAPKVGQTVKVAIKSDALILLPEGTILE